MAKALRVEVDFSRPSAPVDIRRHGLSQGGTDDIPLTPPVIRKVKALGPQSIRVFVQEFYRMMAAPGRYRWAKVDAMIKSIVATGAMPIMALCMKPKCLFPKVDETITKPSNWKAWEDFIAAMARHYALDLKMPGLWYEVGNEIEIGELGGCPYRFTPQGYAEFYARTARAVLRGDPSAKVGGFGAASFSQSEGGPIKKEFLHAMAKRVAAENLPFDFFSWHFYDKNCQELSRNCRQVRAALDECPGRVARALSVLDEWNISWVCSLQFGEYLQSSFVVNAVASMLDAGLDMSHYYHIMNMHLDQRKWRPWYSNPQRIARVWSGNYQALNMMTQKGEAAAAYVAFRMLYRLDGLRLPAKPPSGSVGVLASRTEQSCRILAWNYHHEQIAAADVDLSVVNLPRRALTATHYRLGGELNDLDCVFQMRDGKMLQVDSRRQSGGEFKAKLNLQPYSVYLIELDTGATGRGKRKPH